MFKKTCLLTVLLFCKVPTAAWAGFVCPPNSAPVCCNGPEDPGCAPKPRPPTRPPYQVEGSGTAEVETDSCRTEDRMQAIAQSRAKARSEAQAQCPGGWLALAGEWQEHVYCAHYPNNSRYGFWSSESASAFVCRDSRP